MAHFVAFSISFQKIIPSKIPPGGGEQGLLVAQGLLHVYVHDKTLVCVIYKWASVWQMGSSDIKILNYFFGLYFKYKLAPSIFYIF